MPSAPLRLRIVLDGQMPGAAEHRLSLGSLALPLAQLLRATRRIASDLIHDSGQYSSSRGAYAKEARAIDLQLESIGQGCIEMNIAVTLDESATFQKGLFPQEMLVRTVGNLFDAIKAESAGEERNLPVRTFLRTLPAGLQRQNYQLLRDGMLLKQLDLSSMSLPDISLPPFIDTVIGTVSGISFYPGPFEVWLKPDAGGLLRCAADSQSTDKALSLRSIPIEALLLRRLEKPRLLWLEPQGSRKISSHEQKLNHVLERWNAVLSRLAQ